MSWRNLAGMLGSWNGLADLDCSSGTVKATLNDKIQRAKHTPVYLDSLHGFSEK
jgi:hypothetical protein